MSPQATSPLHGGVDRNNIWGGGEQSLADVAPSRGRGSKRHLVSRHAHDRRSPLHGGVDRNSLSADASSVKIASPLHGGVDRNQETPSAARMLRLSPLHGGVDRNPLVLIGALQFAGVAPSRGRGSKLVLGEDITLGARSPLHGGVDRNDFIGREHHKGGGVAPSRGRGSKPVRLDG